MAPMKFIDTYNSFSKIWIIIVLIVFIAGGIFAWQYFEAPKEKPEDETANWKAYRNEDYGFEVKYPQNSEIKIKDPSYWCQEEKEYSCLEYVQILPDGTNIVVYGNPENFSTKEWLNKYMAWVFTKQCNSKEIKIGENNGIKAICTDGARGIDNFISKGNHLFMIGISLGLDSEKTEETFNQMLSTFKFLELEKVPEKVVEETYIKVLSTDGKERLEEENSYTIKWEQAGLTNWGNKVTVCLIGFDVNGKAIPAKENWRSPACAYGKSSSGLASYLIDKTTLTTQRYNWIIPKDITERFEDRPYNFKISLLVFDELPPEGRTEWAGLIAQDESDNYFNIWRSYKNTEYNFEIRYPNNWAAEVKQPSYLCQEGPSYDCLASIQFSPPFPLVKTLKDIDLVITSNPNGYSATEWIEKYTPEILSDPKTSLYKNIKIGENEWAKLLTTINTNNQRVAFSVAKNNKLYSFGTVIGQGMEEAENILNQMLSTFRFLE